MYCRSGRGRSDASGEGGVRCRAIGEADAGRSACDIRRGGHSLVGAGVFLQLAKRDVQRRQRVLAGLGDLLVVARHLGFHPGQAGEAHQQQHQEGEQRDRDQQREAALIGLQRFTATQAADGRETSRHGGALN